MRGVGRAEAWRGLWSDGFLSYYFSFFDFFLFRLFFVPFVCVPLCVPWRRAASLARRQHSEGHDARSIGPYTPSQAHPMS